MTVLPQLEQELLAAHGRRRLTRFARLGLGRVGPALAVAASVLVVVAVVAVAVVGHDRSLGSAGHGSQLRAAPLRSVVLLKGPLRFPRAYSTGSCLYVAVQITPFGARVVHSELLRVDPLNGGSLASRRLDGQFDHALLVNGELWVTTTQGASTSLWGLDPATLRVLSQATLAGSGSQHGLTGSLALAGGWLWVGTAGALSRVSLLTGTVTRALLVPRDDGVEVAADASARVLLVSVGNGTAYLQRRDPDTGALIATSGPFVGSAQPMLGGIVNGRAWLSEAEGTMGYVERIGPGPMSDVSQPRSFPRTNPTLMTGTNGIGVRLIEGILYITQFGGGPQRNYCADPIGGRIRAVLPFTSSSMLLAADQKFIYYVPSASDPSSEQIARAPIDPRCR